MLAKGDMGLGEGLGEAEMIEAVEDRIKIALNLGGASLWGILAGLSQLNDDNALLPTKQNKKAAECAQARRELD